MCVKVILSISIALFLFNVLPTVAHAQLIESRVNDTVEDTNSTYVHSSPTTVCVDVNNCFVFYINASTGLAMASSTDGGLTWSSEVNVDATNGANDVANFAVWYDGWTAPGTTTQYIHIASTDIGLDDVYYIRYDIAARSFSTPALGTTQSATCVLATAPCHTSITKASNNVIYMGVTDTSDIWVVSCSTTCTTAGNWSERTGLNAALGEDPIILTAIPGGNNILAVRWDTSANNILSNVYSATATAWRATTTVATSKDFNATYEGNLIGIAVSTSTGLIGMALIDDANDYTTQDHDINFYTYASSTNTWTARTNPVTTASGGLTGVKVAYDERNNNWYVVYTRRSTIGTAASADVYYKISSDNGVTWSAELGPINELITEDFYGLSTNFVSGQRIAASWIDNTNEDIYFGTVALLNLPPLTPTLNSPLNTATTSDTTPTLDFTSSDPDSDDIDYLVQISTSSTIGTQIASDDFNRANGGLGSNWSDYTCCTYDPPLIASNAAEATTDDTDAIAYWSGAGTFSDDQYSEATITWGDNGSGGSFAGVVVRAGADSFIGAYKDPFDNDRVYVADRINIVPGDEGDGGTFTVTDHDIADGSVVRLEVIGNRTFLYDDGVLIASGTTTLTTGKPGFIVNADEDVLDNWSGGNTALITAHSSTSAGFANPDVGGDTNPFSSGHNIQYTVQNALDYGTYYWRVSPIDSLGSRRYGTTSSVQNFTIVAPPKTLSGVLYDSNGAPLSGKTIAAAIGTSTPTVHTTISNGGGTFSVEFPSTGSTYGTSTPVVLWVDGDATTRAALFTKASNTNSLANLNLYQNKVIISHEGTSATTTTNSDLSFYDGDNDSDIQYTSNGGVFTVKQNQELRVLTGKTFAPGGAVTINGNAGAAATDGSFTLEGTAIYTAGATTTIAGSFNASSTATFTPGTTTLLFNATTTGKSITVPLTTLGTTTFNGSGGGWTIGTTSTTSNFTILAGTVTAPSTTLSITGNYANSGTFTHNSGTTTFISAEAQTLSGTLVNGSSFNNVTFIGAGTKTLSSNASTSNFIIQTGSGAITAPTSLTVSGNYTNNGTFTAGSGVVNFSSTTAQSIGGTLMGTSAFNNVYFTGSGAKTLSSNASTSNFVIASDSGAVTAPTSLSIGGDYTNSGTFTGGSGTVYLHGSQNQTLSGTLVGTSAFNNLTILNTSGFGSSSQSIHFSASASTTGTFTMVASTSARFFASATSTFQNINLSGAVGQYVWLRSSSPNTQFNFYVPGEQTAVNYVDVRDSNACAATILANNGTNVDSGNNTCWTFVTSSALIESAEDQIFGYQQASTPVSVITITDGASPTITAANDIRIVIATTTTNMRWDTTDVTATFGGTAAAKVSNPVSFLGNGEILVIPVTENFSSSDTLTIADLSFTAFNTVSPAAVSLGVRTSGVGTTTVTNDIRTVTIRGTLVLSDHTLGQVTDNFDDSSDASDVELFAFRLAPAGENESITSLTFDLTGVNRVQTSHLTNLRLYRDLNSDKVYSAGEPQVGGTGDITISGQTGTIAFSTAISATTTQNYVLVTDLVNLITSKSLNMYLNADDIVVTGGTSLTSITVTGSAATVEHRKGNLTGGGPGGSVGGEAPAGDGIRTGGDESGGGGTGDPPPEGDEPETGGGGGGGGAVFRQPEKHIASIYLAWGGIGWPFIRSVLSSFI